MFMNRSASLILALLVSIASPGAGAAEGKLAAQTRFEIPAQSLSASLKQLANQAGIQILFEEQLVRGLEAPAIKTQQSALQALDLLLSNTGLEYTAKDETVAVRKKLASAIPVSRGADAVQMNAVRLAQSEAPVAAGAVEEPEDKKDSDVMMVTGSRLRTSSSASPVTVITQDDIKKLGLNTVEDIIRSLPQNFSTINAAASLDNSINTVDARGQSAVDLRGLGPQNTLVLVNGRRRAATTTFSSGLVNLNTIPAGSIERVEIITDGASAVYGSDAVAGVINFILRSDYQGGESRIRHESSINDGDAFSVDQSLGKSWSSGNITASARYSQTDSVNTRKAGFTTSDFRSLGGGDGRSLTLGQPGVVSGQGSLPAGDDGTNGIAGRLSLANRVPYDSGEFSQIATSETASLSVNVNVEQSLSERIRAYAEVSYADNTSESINGVPIAFNTVVPTTNRFNDSGAAVVVSYAFAEEFLRGQIPATSFDSDQEALGITLGFKMNLPVKDWTADLSVGRSEEDAYFAGSSVSSALLAQRAAGLDAMGNPLPAAQHLNLFGNGTAQDPAALAGLVVAGGFTAPQTNYSTLDTALLTAEGGLLHLPGGEMRLGVGAEVRSEELDFTEDPSRSTIFVVLKPARDVTAAFGEVAVPLVGAGNRMRGIHALDVFAAARWEEYSIDGPFDGAMSPDRKVTFSETSPKFGVSWFVIPQLKIRATLSSSFRAPQLSALFGRQSGPFNFLPIVDPQNPGDGVIFPNVFFGGNAALSPETSDNLTVGVDWKPTGRLQGLSLSLGYSDIDFTDRISSLTTLAFTQPDLLFGIPGAVERGPDNRITQINLNSVNLAARQSENVDVTATYDFDTRAGDVTFGLTGTYAMKLEDISIAGANPIVLDGTQNGPEKRKFRAWVSWSMGHYGMNLYANHSGSYINTQGFGGRQPVDSYTTYDLTGFYRFEQSGWSFNGGVRNLTDSDFPFFNGFGRPWDPRRVDTRGRTLYLEITKKYDLFR